ncbi:MAG TPA: DUF3854 domain-containing protein [Syntrophorhabdaceae bacterium]|nr:DUF3854 domain-containing protein [Syntrophorhabdaceae bacterium]
MPSNKKTEEAYAYFLNGRTDGQALLALNDMIASGLSPATLEEAQVRIFSGSAKTLKERLGQTHFEGMSLMQVSRLTEFPYFNEKGEITLYRYKPSPTLYRRADNEPVKYLHPKDTPAIPYILPQVWAVREKTNKPLWITEGEKKALKLIEHGRPSISFPGVWLFRAGKKSEETESTYLWRELQVFRWAGRTVYLAFDADWWVNPSVREALYEFAFKLYALGALIRFSVWQGAKGIDDLLASHDRPEDTLADIESQAKDIEGFLLRDHRGQIMKALYKALSGVSGVTEKTLVNLVARKLNVKPRDVMGDVIRMRQNEMRNKSDLDPYSMDDEGGVRRHRRERDGGYTYQSLANFTAWISEEVFEDNGQETAMRFVIEGRNKEKEFPKVRIPAPQFNTLNWVMNNWGTEAIIEPGQNTKDYLRHFIQQYSKHRGYARRIVYTHTGWREVKGSRYYLMANGAIGGEGIDVDLPGEFLEMGRYCLPRTVEYETEAIRVSLSFLHIGKPDVTYPGYVYTFLAPLTSILEPIPNFSAYFYGETGSFKSTVATLLLSHFGDFSISNLSNFDSTANQIEKRAFVLKDTLYILDDYHPSAQQKEASAKEAIAQRLIRACSNRTGRERLNPDATDKGKYVPRGMLLITGEELVQLQSTLARVMVVEFGDGAIDVERLTRLQEQRKLLPHAMASYILWVRDNFERLKGSFPAKFSELRSGNEIRNGHRKMSEQMAYLQFTLDTILEWVVEKGALSKNEAGIAREVGRDAFRRIAHKQAERIEQDDPVQLFFGVIDSLLTQGKARLDGKDSGYKECKGGESGELIGYYDEGYYYLLPRPAWHLVETYLRPEGGRIPFSRTTLYAVLEKRGIIETKEGKHTIPVKMQGVVKRVLKLKRGGSNDPFECPLEAAANDE